MYTKRLREKLTEALKAIGPIVAIMLLLSLTVAPLPSGILLVFLLGSLLLIVGEMFFSLGAELAMGPMGERMGASVTRTRKLPLILGIGFLLGFMITIAEPDLQVLATQVQSIPNPVLIFSVAGGVGIFLVIAFLRMLFRIPLRTMLLVFYSLAFLLTVFAPADFLTVAFDAGGVTTGPMTVPFIMAFGVGISAIRNDKSASDDSLGLVALCSVGPIMTVLILSLIYRPESVGYDMGTLPDVSESVAMGRLFAKGFPEYMLEMARSLLPTAGFFLVYELIFIRMNRSSLQKIVVGVLYTYFGLVLFLTGANVGFMPAGLYLGKTLIGLPYRWILIPVGVVIGFFIVKAEPAVYVLMRQVESITDGAVSGRSLQISLCFGVAASVGLAMIRVLTGISILWMIVPGYFLALVLSFFVPPIFTAIAFDSGGVASGPMTATFLLPLAIGACLAVGGNVVTDAFGVVAMVAMTPLITLQILGLLSRLRGRKRPAAAVSVNPYAELDDFAIIEL